jgi:hypothetical protein
MIPTWGGRAIILSVSWSMNKSVTSSILQIPSKVLVVDNLHVLLLSFDRLLRYPC